MTLFGKCTAAMMLLVAACTPATPGVHSPAESGSSAPNAKMTASGASSTDAGASAASAPLAANSSSSALATSLPPQPAAPTLDADAVRGAVQPVLKLVMDDSPPLDLEFAAQPSCTVTECMWKATARERDVDRTIAGTFEVDDKSRQVWWMPNDGRERRFSAAEYSVYHSRERAAQNAVSQFPDVRSYCKQLRAARQPVNCIIFVSEPPHRQCTGDPDYHDEECFWQVYVGEHQETHLVRHATFLVSPEGGSVVAVSDAGCGLMSLSEWRLREARVARARNAFVDCPEP